VSASVRTGGDAAGKALFAAYGLLVSAAVWFVLVPFELLRILARRSSWQTLRERLGLWEAPPARGCRLLMHAVSAGEVAAAGAVLRRLAAEEPALSVVLTTGNRDGLAAARRLASRLPVIDAAAYLPWDRPRAVRRFLESVRPDLAAVVETEIWPALFLACPALRIPLVIVNGRVLPGDVARYHRAHGFFRRVLASAQWIGAQNAAEADRFLTIGARPDTVHVSGSLKFDLAFPPPPAAGALARALAGDPPVVVAGSTHAPEESLLLRALVDVRREQPDTRLVVAPRHTRRAPAIVRLSRRLGLGAFPLSRLSPGAAWDVLVLDSIGLLAGAYGRARVAFVGGSLAPVGGHNPLEAAAHGVPVVMGPHTEHVADAVLRLSDAGALARVDGAGALSETLRALLSDETRRADMGSRARAAAEAGRGAAEATARALLVGLREA